VNLGFHFAEINVRGYVVVTCFVFKEAALSTLTFPSTMYE
jgi:hypothetical protein